MSELFQVHKLNAVGLTKARHIQNQFTAVLSNLVMMCGEGREMAIVKTKMEEACFFAKKAMAIQKENQEVYPPDEDQIPMMEMK